MTTTDTATRIPLVDYLALDPEPHLVASECKSCGARYFDHRDACASCFEADFTSVDLWILGITMTKFGKHPDIDSVGLAAQAARGALKDGGVSMRDIGILAAGNLMGGGALGQQLQKQIGQTGIPVYNVANACATG